MTGINPHDYKYPKKKGSEHWSRSEAWKRIVKAMYHGEWMTIPQLQAILRVRRSGLRNILANMIKAGVMETRLDKTFERTTGRTKWLDADASPDGKPKYRRRDGLLPRNRRYYRLMMEKITIEVQKKNPSK